MSANDKPTVLPKPVSGDAAEQRLKTEVKQLPARDRRRLKEIPDVSTTFDIPNLRLSSSILDSIYAKGKTLAKNLIVIV